MKILLLNPPAHNLVLRDQYNSFTSKANYYWPSIDLLVQSGILSQKHQVYVVDAVVDKMDKQSCLKKIIEIAPQVILFITGITSYKYDFIFMDSINSKLDCKIFVSGGFLLDSYDFILHNYNFIHAILMNFCSDAILKYLDGSDNITDLVYRKGDSIEYSPGMDKTIKYPLPRHELFHIEKYRLPHAKRYPFSCVITNYGCPFHCKFCVAQNIKYRERDVEDVIEELISLDKLGIKEIFFRDFTFGVNKKNLLLLCDFMKKNTDLSWVCATRADILDEVSIKAMKEAGCHTIQFGIETSNKEILTNYKDKIKIEQIQNSLFICKKHGINTLGHFIIGLPGETKKTIKETIKFSKKMKCDYASFNIATPLFGTELRKECIENDWIDNTIDDYDLTTGKAAIHTDQLSQQTLCKLKNYAIRSFYFRPSYIFNRLRKIHSLKNLTSLVTEGLAIFRNYFKDIHSV